MSLNKPSDASIPGSRPIHRLLPVEGLRGYLALWVFVSHTLLTAGYDHLVGLLQIVRQGGLAVDCFMIISGFVIFLLLDTRREAFGPYILRRFFRLYPAYLFLFLAAIPCLWVSRFNVLHPQTHYAPEVVAAYRAAIDDIWRNLALHVPLHLTMLHGVVPSQWLAHSSTAILGPAWSLSLEWQFYLLAPFWFRSMTSPQPWARMVGYALCLAAILGARRFLPPVEEGAALPFHVEHFFVGIVSYFVYRWFHESAWRVAGIFPCALICSLALYRASDKALTMLPFCLWIVFFALLLEPLDSFPGRRIARLFSNPLAVWLGKISYSVYLSHALVLVLVQALLLQWAPQLSRFQHWVAIFLLSLPATLLLSSLLYSFVEAPCIKLGNRLTRSRVA